MFELDLNLRPPGVFVVAIEYAGDTVPAGGGSRQPQLEHAWEVHTGVLPAHLQLAPRVAFTDPVRGWPYTSGVARCEPCDLFVATALRMIIAHAFTVVHRQRLALWRSPHREPLARFLPDPPSSGHRNRHG